MTRRLVVLSLLALTLWAYSSVWSAAFVYEDQLTQTYAQRWLTTQTWQVVNSPSDSHGFNLALHLIAAALVVRLAFGLGLRGLGLWAAGGIWLVHPLNVESVAYAASRGELLALIFLVSAAILALGPWRAWPALGLVGCLVAAMLSKESGVVGLLLIPFVLAWTDPTPRWRTWAPLGLSAALIACGVWSIGLRTLINYGGTDFVSAGSVTVWSWVGLQAAAAHHWLGSALWLTGLTPDADIDAVPMIGRWISVGVLVGLAGLAWMARRSQPLVTFGLGWTVIALLPRFVVQTPQSYLNAHQFIVPFVGIVLLMALGCERAEAWASR